MTDDEAQTLGVLQGAVMGLQREVALLRQDFRDHMAGEDHRLADIQTQIRAALSFQDQISGGLRVSRALWSIWVAVVSAAVGILTLLMSR